MDLSEAPTDGDSGEATRVDRRCRGGSRSTATNFTTVADEATLVSGDTPNAESKLAEAYTVETITVGKIRKEAGEVVRLTEEID